MTVIFGVMNYYVLYPGTSIYMSWFFFPVCHGIQYSQLSTGKCFLNSLKFNHLGGGFKYLLIFTCIHFDSYFSEGVGSTTNPSLIRYSRSKKKRFMGQSSRRFFPPSTRTFGRWDTAMGRLGTLWVGEDRGQGDRKHTTPKNPKF